MKNSINLMLATMFMLTLTTSLSLHANPVNGLIIKVAPSAEGRAFNLQIANLEKQLTKVKVIDVFGYALHSEMVVKEVGYSSKVNLANLPIGDYLLRIEHPSGAFTHAFHLGGEAVTFFEAMNKNEGFTQLVNQSERMVDFPGHFSASGNKLNVELIGLGGKQVNIHVCNLQGKIFNRKKIKGENTLNENMALENLPAGEYMLVIRTGKKTVIQPFEKNANSISLKNTLFSKPVVQGEMEIYSQK